MRTTFIIIAIFVAVVLLVRFAAPHAKPRFAIAERVTKNVLLNNIRALGKKCAVTEHGFGITDTVKIRRIIDECKKRVEAGNGDDWQCALNSGSSVISRAYSEGKKDIRHTAYCGHVEKYPRVYLFCEMLVSLSDCEITRESILSAIAAFEENAPFTLSERKILCGVLKFCLIGHLCVVAQSALKRGAVFDKGVLDGKSGKVDLDYIHSDDYVCGLLDGCSDSERNAIVRLFEYNSVDIDSCDCSRRKALSQIYLTVNSVLQSLSAIDECRDEIYTQAEHGGERTKRYVMVCNILFPTLLVAYAVFTCIFASPKYVALFSVAAIITYGIMRVPVLLHSPPQGIDIFAPIEKLLYKLFNHTKIEATPNRIFMSETAYFGGEAEYIESTIEGEVKAYCNNRGGITVKFGSVADELYVGIETDGTKTSLAECDCAIESHRATYRVSKHNMELCAEVVVPIDCSACIVKLTIVNRSDCDESVTVTGAVVRSVPVEQTCTTENINGGAMATCNNSFALSLGMDGEYGGDLSTFCKENALKHGLTNKPGLIGRINLSVERFSRAVSYMTVVYASSISEAESRFRQMSDPTYFSRVILSSSVYCKLNKSHVLPVSQDIYISNSAPMNLSVYPAPPLPKREVAYDLPFGGLTDNGDIVITNNDLYKPIDNTVANSAISVVLSQYGIQNISADGKSVTPQPDKFLYTPQAFVVIGEKGVLWSPTFKPLGCGQIRTKHGRGYTEYTCAYNGTVCTQKCFATKSGAAFVDITLCNQTDSVRSFDIMFSAVCKSGTTVAISDSGVTAETDGNKLLFCALGESAEYAQYKEAYFVYGKIALSSGFRTGGSTPAPTLSVGKTVKARQSARVVFCIADSKCAQKFDINAVDELFVGTEKFFNRLGRILPKTSDGILNISYMRALYSAYKAFVVRKSASLYEEGLVLSAAKYVDTSAVKNRIYELLSNQKMNGQLGDDYFDCLQLVYCIIEYVEFVGDGGFWNEVLPYAPYNSRGKRVVRKATVYNHVLHAAEYLITTPLRLKQGTVNRIWQYKNLIYVLRFFEYKFTSNADLLAAYKKCFAFAADGYSREVKTLTANNFFEFNSRAQAYMCAKLLFDLDLNEKAYNIIKFNNPIERGLFYGGREVASSVDYFSDPISSAVYFTTVTERLFGVKFKGKTVKISSHIAANTPSLQFDIYGKTKDVHITVDDTELKGNWKMRVNRINYPADSVDIGELSDDIVFYRDGNE